MNKLQAVFWDVDGTLADTEMDGHRKAFNFAFRDKNIEWHWNKALYTELLTITGGKNRIKHYSDRIDYVISQELIESIHSRKQYYYKELLQEGLIPARNGVTRLLNQLNRLNVKQWIVTTSGKEAVESLLKTTLKEESHIFEGVIANQDVTRHKPDPSAYLLALEKSNTSAANSIAIEDSLAGLYSSFSANINTLVTLTSWNNIDIKEFNKSSAILDSLGNQNSKVKVLKGPICKNGIVDINYLEELINRKAYE